MEKAQLERMLRQYCGTLRDIGEEMERIVLHHSARPKALFELTALYLQTEVLIRLLLDAYVDGNTVLTDLLERRYFEMELHTLLENTDIVLGRTG